MTPTLIKRALQLAAIPVGVGLGLSLALLTVPGCPAFVCQQNPVEARFAPWMCALIGGAAAAALVLVSMTIRQRDSNSGTTEP
jgi:ABC-type Fe3+-siderophore transport system permease subunit